ncbi:hypothetical protein MMC19_001664 [Ptychographa xylographoides]|nr:hypothetical protein [Ptychographa xylographoides]
MSHSQSLITTAEALRYVFFPSTLFLQSRITQFHPRLYQHRSLSYTPSLSYENFFRRVKEVDPSTATRSSRNNGSQPAADYTDPRNLRGDNYRPPLRTGPRSFRNEDHSSQGNYNSQPSREDTDSSRVSTLSYRPFVAQRKFGPKDTSNSASRRFGPKFPANNRPRDEAIGSRTICLVNAENKLSPPTYLADVIASLDRRTQVVEQVSDPEDSQFPFPVCKILNKKEERERQKRRAKAAKSQTKMMPKKLELSWAIGAHDLEHRMRRVQDFIDDGRRVDVVIGATLRKGQAKKAEKIERKVAFETMRNIEIGLKGVQGAKEYRPREGFVGGLVTIYVEQDGKKNDQGKTAEDGKEEESNEATNEAANEANSTRLEEGS